MNSNLEEMKNRINSSWFTVFGSNLCDEYFSVLDQLFETYTHDGLDGFRFRKEKDDEVIKLYPEVFEFTLPFQMCDFTKLKAIIVFDEPMTNGWSRGIPWLYRADENALPETTGDDDYMSWFCPSLNVIQYFLKDIRNYQFKTYDYRKDNVCPSINVEDWINQGILPIYASLSVEYDTKYCHSALWRNFVVDLLVKVLALKPELQVLALGELAIKATSMLPETNVTNLNKELQSFANQTNPDLPNVFQLLNSRLITAGSDIINW